MGEAAEIAKLRLFLKLVAQLDDVLQIEPLPDLDFNIKTGNLLVGIADPSDVTRRFGDVLQSFPGLAAAEQAAGLAADAYDQFTAAQLLETSAGGVSGKHRLASQIQAATNQADNALFDMRGESGSFEEWRRSHVPFHWFAEFPSVWRNGGFDVIVGNPPYINKRKVTEYVWRGYATEKCPDLYAVCVERASALLNERGRMAMIVMHSLCFSRGFKPLRKYLAGVFPAIWVSSYAKRPDSLFAGSADVRNTIIVSNSSGESGLLTSRCRRWLALARPWLFPTQEYLGPDADLLRCGSVSQWPFADSLVVAEALARLVREQYPLSSVLSSGPGFVMGYKKVAHYMFGLFIDPPPIIMPDGTLKTERHREHGWLCFGILEQRDAALLVLSSRWAYLWWMMYGDEFHVTKNVLTAFPAGVDRLLASPHRWSLLELAQNLQEELVRHLKWQTNARIRVGRYDLRECRHITDEADWLLAKTWGLTREQYEVAGNLRDRMTFGTRD